jgi:hypothetical protein
MPFSATGHGPPAHSADRAGFWTWNGACHGAEARVGVTRARWPPATLPRRGLAVKGRVQGGESEVSRA